MTSVLAQNDAETIIQELKEDLGSKAFDLAQSLKDTAQMQQEIASLSQQLGTEEMRSLGLDIELESARTRIKVEQFKRTELNEKVVKGEQQLAVALARIEELEANSGDASVTADTTYLRQETVDIPPDQNQVGSAHPAWHGEWHHLLEQKAYYWLPRTERLRQ